MSNNRTKFLICAFLMISTFVIYSQVQYHEFINYDDDVYVTENPLIKTDFTSQSVIQFFTNTDFVLWLPITSLSYLLDYQFYGLNPKGFLLTNLLFHITNSLLLFLILFRITGAIWKSTFVAAMFAFHPLNVESVAWVSERKNVLSTLFFLLTIMTYTNYVDKPTAMKYSLVFLCFTLGLMSKPMLVTLPFLLLLLDYWPLRRLKFAEKDDNNKILAKNADQNSETFQLVLEKIPLFILTFVFTSLMFYHTKVNAGFYLPLQSRLMNATVSYVRYLEKMLWPNELSLFYAHPGNDLALWKVILCALTLIVITIISIRFIKKTPYFAVGWFWYLGTLVPVIGIFQVSALAMADRYSYITLIGIFIVIAWGLPDLISNWRYKEKVLSVSTGIIIIALLLTTWKQVGHWKNSITIFNHAIRVTDKKYPSFSLVHNNLGQGLYLKGRKEEAINNYMIAIKLNPMHVKPYYNLGIALYDKGKSLEAISNYKIAVKLKPDFTYAHYNLGLVLFQAGKVKKAVHHFREVVRLEPDLIAARNYLRLAKLRLQKLN